MKSAEHKNVYPGVIKMNDTISAECIITDVLNFIRTYVIVLKSQK